MSPNVVYWVHGWWRVGYDPASLISSPNRFESYTSYLGVSMEKVCSTCKTKKDITQFGTRSNSKDGKLGQCKECVVVYFKEYRDNNRKYFQAKLNRYRKRTRDYLISVKASTPCADCGSLYHPCVMDFDHVTGDKTDNVSNIAASGRLSALKREIAKCELVCSNCHRVRTYNRRLRDVA